MGAGRITKQTPLTLFHKSSKNPVLSQIADGENPIYSTGHGSVVASPPRDSWEKVGAQDVTLRTPKGSELFYVHHARNDTARDRSIYSTRMTLDESAVSFGSNDAISMHLTSADQLLPQNTYPIRIDARCGESSESGNKIVVRVSSRQNSAFDLREGSSRVVSLPGDETTTSIGDGNEDGTFVLGFGNANPSELAYQRMDVHGTWSTVVSNQIRCK